jgi:predicted Zn-dependent protease
MSYRRFTAAFNDETPNSGRLALRLKKQALSSIGHCFDVERCDTPWCARAYPNNLQEHDAKSAFLCAKCRAGFQLAFKKYGLDKPLPDQNKR